MIKLLKYIGKDIKNKNGEIGVGFDITEIN